MLGLTCMLPDSGMDARKSPRFRMISGFGHRLKKTLKQQLNARTQRFAEKTNSNSQIYFSAKW